MSKYKWPLAIGVSVVFVLMSLNAPPAAICIALALYCLAYAAWDWWRERNAPPPTEQPPEARITFGQRPPPASGAPLAPQFPPQQWDKTPFRQAPALPGWQQPAHDFSERMQPAIASVIDDLRMAVKAVRSDPILQINQSQLMFIFHSAIVRHGILIERAIFEALCDHERFAAWHDVKFQADDGHTIQVDLIAFDKAEGVIRAFEIKRGWGDNLGAHADKQSRVSMPAVEAKLIGFAASKGYQATKAVTHFISYYGQKVSVGGSGDTINEHTLDERFQIPVRSYVEYMTAAYKAALRDYLTETGWWSYAPDGTPRLDLGVADLEHATPEMVH